MQLFDIDTIKNIHSGNKKLIVLKGIEKNDVVLSELKNIFDLYEEKPILDFDKRDMSRILVANTAIENDVFYCSYEEYLFMEDLLTTFFDCYCLENNLYFKEFPYKDNINNIESFYEKAIESDSYEKYDNEGEFEEIFKIFGDAKRDIHGKYRVVYSKANQDFISTYPYYILDDGDHLKSSIEEMPQSEGRKIRFEISEDEEDFFNLIKELDKSKDNLEISLTYTDELKNLPNNFHERLSILSKIYDKEIFLIPKKTEERTIENAGEYLSILDKYWGYSGFKNLKMYRNVDKGNELIEISQMQIIDDIVVESENAINGKNFRDIYVTSSTGSGKSIMFQIPALYLAEKYKEKRFLTIVISPLIGLMDDQVRGMKDKSIKTAATIHSNISLSKKENIIDRIKDGSIDIVYMSTETLQSRADIKTIIGERRIGLLVVDEAHIVTTWGKSFRADYWYMGSYLNRLRKETLFPIVTFTATAIYGGREDMYSETKNSLNMINTKAYFGYVKRDNILLKVNNNEKEALKNNREYLKTKNLICLKRIKKFIKDKEKTVVYFATVKSLMRFYRDCIKEDDKLSSKVVIYHGQLDKHEKSQGYLKFLEGECLIMLATKAFGMGIDIKDIKNVYHYTPTGDVIDYVQEIGRAARDGGTGIAHFDYLKNDFNDIKRLHGLSSIKKHELLGVMDKIKKLYSDKKSRHLTASTDDFKYIFSNGNIRSNDEYTVDNKVKIALLMVEKDFIKKYGYSPFVARPKKIFGKEIVFVTNKSYRRISKSKYFKYFDEMLKLDNDFYEGIYVVDLEKIWSKYFQNISFPSFKYQIHSSEDNPYKRIFEEIYPGLQININMNIKPIQAKQNISNINKAFLEFLGINAIKGKFFNVEDLDIFIKGKLKIRNDSMSMNIANSLINSLIAFNRITRRSESIIKTKETAGAKNGQSYTVNNNIDDYKREIERYIQKVFDNGYGFRLVDGFEIKQYMVRSENKNNKTSVYELEMFQIILSISESYGDLSYSLEYGNSPQIYIRMNSISPIDNEIKKGRYYKNTLLNEAYDRNNISTEMLSYLFKIEVQADSVEERIRKYSVKFWDEIEQYFLGKLPDEVMQQLKIKKDFNLNKNY